MEDEMKSCTSVFLMAGVLMACEPMEKTRVDMPEEFTLAMEYLWEDCSSDENCVSDLLICDEVTEAPGVTSMKCVWPECLRGSSCPPGQGCTELRCVGPCEP
jgi:hypothetical protein